MLVFKPTYYITVTAEPDEDYLKYLRRRIGIRQPVNVTRPMLEITRLDISVDDDEGDVVAGLAAYTSETALKIDLLWVDKPLRGEGLGAKLVHMAEDIARERGCNESHIQTRAAQYYTRFGYVITGQANLFPGGEVVYFLHKPLVQEESATRKDSA